MKTILPSFLALFFFGLAKGEIKQADPTSFQSLIESEDAIVLDVRTPQEIGKGKITDASELDFYGDDFDRKLSFLQKDKAILVYCRSGGRSGEAARKLEKLGFSNIVNLQGGFTAWESKSLPVEVPKNRGKVEKQKPIDSDEFKSQLQENKIVLLDFHTNWCSPCKKMAPVIDQVESEHADQLKVIRIDMDANPELAAKYSVKAVPTYVILKGEEEQWRTTGITAITDFEEQILP